MSNEKMQADQPVFGVAPHAPNQIVYVREVSASELPGAPPGIATLYAIHDAAGKRLAIASDRNVAFAVARRNDLTPVSAH